MWRDIICMTSHRVLFTGGGGIQDRSGGGTGL